MSLPVITWSVIVAFHCHIHLRNEFNFWNVHGIMNTSVLLQSKWSPNVFRLTLQETRSIHDSMNRSKIEFISKFTFYNKYLKYKTYSNLGIKTVLFFKYNHINCFVRVSNGKAEQPTWTRTANEANKRLVLHVRLGCGSLSITTTVSLLANEFDVRNVLPGQVSFAAVNQICVIHEAMNSCKNLFFY